MVRSVKHWIEDYCVSHPAVSSDHTLSGSRSVSQMCVCEPACACLFFSSADHLESCTLKPLQTIYGSFVSLELFLLGPK